MGRKGTNHSRRATLLRAVAPLAMLGAWFGTAFAQSAGGVDPTHVLTGGAVLFALASALWAVRVSMAGRTATVDWSRKLANMEARFERAESILATHPGLVLVWDDSLEDLDTGWGRPRVLGGPAALASLLTFAADDPAAFANPADSLLSALGRLPLEGDEQGAAAPTLQDKVRALRSHGIAFSGAVITDEGRPIECDGRVAGDQVTLWLTDPAARLAEDKGVVGQARDRAADLHGALNQLDRAPIVAWRRGPDLRLEWVNRAYVDLVEAINMQQVLDEQIEVDPAFRALAEKARSDAELAGRRTVDGIVKVTARGQRRVLRIIETPMHGAGEASFGGMAIDISRQERAHDDLKRQQAAHRRTLDQLSAAVAVFDATQSLEYYNQAFLDLFGLDDAELRARPSHAEWLDRLRHLGRLPAQADFAAWKRSQLRLYTEEAVESGSATEGAAPDEIWSLPGGKILRVRQQRHALGGVSIVFENITETLGLQSRFQTQIKVQRSTLNNLAEGVAVFRQDGCLQLYNRSFEAMWGLGGTELDAHPHVDSLVALFSEFSEGGDAAIQVIKARIVSMADEDRVATVGDEIRLRDGRVLLSTTSPLPDGATLLTFLDVTDAREREKELETRNGILEEADRIKTRFVDHISYQLRNPLNTITGFAEMLENEYVGTLNEKQKEYISSILSASNTLLDLFTDIIDLAAIDAGRLIVDMHDVDVYALLRDAQGFAMLKADDSRIQLRLDCAPDIGVIRADERRIRQVLFNLLANAFNFTDAGGTVTLGAIRDGDAIQIFVADSGRGVSMRDQPKVFNRFESAGPGAGAGLGLALVNSFVELHGGFVRLLSQEGAGTVVTCFLPVRGPSNNLRPAHGAAPEVDSAAGPPLLAASAAE